MERFRYIHASFWTDPKVRELSTDERLLLLYLITNPHSHVSGIYYLPDALIAHETGLSSKSIGRGIDTLSRVGIVLRDRASEVVFVRNMLKYQGSGDKVWRAAAQQLEDLHNCSLIADFMDLYPQVRDRVSDRVSSPRARDEEKDEDEEKDVRSSAPSRDARSAPEVPDELSPFPLFAKDPHLCRSWPRLREEWSEAFPGVSLQSELRKAHAWQDSNPTRVKKRQARFLYNWLTRAQDRGSRNHSGNQEARHEYDAEQGPNRLQRFFDAADRAREPESPGTDPAG